MMCFIKFKDIFVDVVIFVGIFWRSFEKKDKTEIQYIVVMSKIISKFIYECVGYIFIELCVCV